MTSDQYRTTGVMTGDDVADMITRYQRHLDLSAAEAIVAVVHSMRFRRVANGYARVVALAYNRDLERAAADTDEQVAATVAAWERAEGLEPRDWHAIGADEGKLDR